jgi:hypothetical protein
MLIRSHQNNIIVDTGFHLCHVQHIVSILPQLFDNRTINALIRKQIHAACSVKRYTISARKALAAKANAANSASWVRRGWASKICSSDSPAATLVRIDSTVMRASDNGLPHHHCRSETISCLFIRYLARIIPCAQWMENNLSRGVEKDIQQLISRSVSGSVLLSNAPRDRVSDQPESVPAGELPKVANILTVNASDRSDRTC